jgi:hypothetical protein
MAQPLAPGPSSFRRFRQLPPELRLHIWSFAIPRRIIDVGAFNKRLSPSQERNPLKDDRVYVHQNRVPLLDVCYESRMFALHVYRHSLDTEDQRSDRFQVRRDEFPAHVSQHWAGCHLPCRRNSQSIPGEIRPKIYFNLKEDVFCLNTVWWCVGRHPLYSLRNYLSAEILQDLRYLALPFEMFAWAVSNDVHPKASKEARDRRVTLADFRSLREIIINIDCREDERGERDLSDISHEDITNRLEAMAKRNPGWKIPKWRLVKNRASLGLLVRRELLT